MAQEPIPVTTAKLDDWIFHPAADAPAEVIALRETHIPAEINAPLDDILVEAGDPVKQDQVLARLDCTLFKNNLLAANARGQALDAQISLARQQLQRAQQLVEQRNASRELVDQRNADLRRLQADRRAQNAVIASADNDVAHCTVTAPFDGTITQRHLSPGAYVSVGTPLLTILDPKAVELEADVPHELMESLKAARAIHFELEYRVFIRAAMPTVSATTAQQAIRLGFMENKPLAGVTGRIRWESREFAVPAELLVRRDGLLGIFLERDGKAHFEHLSEALEGRPAKVDLPRDTRLIIDGREAVTDGQAIRVVNTTTESN